MYHRYRYIPPRAPSTPLVPLSLRAAENKQDKVCLLPVRDLGLTQLKSHGAAAGTTFPGPKLHGTGLEATTTKSRQSHTVGDSRRAGDLRHGGSFPVDASTGPHLYP